MNDMVESLTKLASELTDRVERFEKTTAELTAENASLKAQLAEAQAGQAKQAAVKTVDETVVNASVDALIKVGALTEDQRQASHDCMMKDPDAVHRVLIRVLDAHSQTKTAKAADTDDLRGGRLATAPDRASSMTDQQGACYERMCKILGLS